MGKAYPQNPRKQAPTSCAVCCSRELELLGTAPTGDPLLWCWSCGSCVRWSSGEWRISRPGLLVDTPSEVRFASPSWRNAWLRSALRDVAELLSPTQWRSLLDRWEPSHRWARAVLIWGSDRPIPLEDGRPKLDQVEELDTVRPGLEGPYRKDRK